MIKFSLENFFIDISVRLCERNENSDTPEGSMRIERVCENCLYWLVKSSVYAWIGGVSFLVGQCCAAAATGGKHAPCAQTNGDAFVFTQPSDFCKAFEPHPEAEACCEAC
jgi:hypothetical protein